MIDNKNNKIYNKYTFKLSFMIHSITLQDIRKKGEKTLLSDETSFLIINSRLLFAVVPIEEYQRLEAMKEEWEDRQIIDQRKDEKEVEWENIDCQCSC
jgi:hypothetical protein